MASRKIIFKKRTISLSSQCLLKCRKTMICSDRDMEEAERKQTDRQTEREKGRGWSEGGSEREREICRTKKREKTEREKRKLNQTKNQSPIETLTPIRRVSPKRKISNNIFKTLNINTRFAAYKPGERQLVVHHVGTISPYECYNKQRE